MILSKYFNQLGIVYRDYHIQTQRFALLYNQINSNIIIKCNVLIDNNVFFSIVTSNILTDLYKTIL